MLYGLKILNFFEKQRVHKFIITLEYYNVGRYNLCTVRINYFRLIMHTAIKPIYINHDLRRYAAILSRTKSSRVIKNYQT